MGGCNKNKNEPDKDTAKDISDHKKEIRDALKDATRTFSVEGADTFKVSEERKTYLVLLTGATREPDEDLVRRHVEHLDRLADEDRLDMFGAFAEGDGGMQIVVASSDDEARELAQSDPLVSEGIYTGVEVREVRS
jgi:uncharacterized protein YciI